MVSRQVKIIIFIFVVCIILGILCILGGIGMFNKKSSPTIPPTVPPTESPTIPPTESPTIPNITESPTGSPTIPPTIPPTESPTIPPTKSPSPGILANFSPTSNGKIWKKVFDSMLTSNKCFINFSSISSMISVATSKKINKYIINNNLLPIDNPFKGIIDVPIVKCSPEGSRLVLTLDLSMYGGINPFKQGYAIYIFGVNGTLNANTKIDSTNKITQPRFVYATNNEYSKYVQLNQIMVSQESPCDYMNNCGLDKGSPLFSEGTYTNGGIVRIVGTIGGAEGFIPQRPQLMFYLYTCYKNYKFNWPYTPVTVSEIYNIYSGYYNGYMQWIANLPQTCTQPGVITTPSNLTSGQVTVSGGSGSGLQMYVISANLFGSAFVYPIVTSDGGGYINGETITITQGSVSENIQINTGANCDNQQGFTLNGPIYLSYSITLSQLKNLLSYASENDPSINTIIMYTNNSITVPDNYNNPNITIMFGKTTPDSVGFTGNNYIPGIFTNPLICECDSKQDQFSLYNYFPNKINKCANQVIFTSDSATQSFDFINNADIITNSCSVRMC